MKTRERLVFLARAYPKLFPRVQLTRLVETQLGAVDALDRPSLRHGVHVQARAPRHIHHICAGNLAISAITSIALGLILGSRNTVKLPGPREDELTRREIVRFVAGLPKSLRSLVQLHTARNDAALHDAEVIMAFGSDATMATLRTQVRADQRFIAHGHAVSLLWIANPAAFEDRQARACAIDVLTYDQLGCLSPQAIYFPPDRAVEVLGARLAGALEKAWQLLPKKPARPLGTRARIAEARDVALALSHRVWRPPGDHLGWTIIHDPDSTFAPSPLHGVIYLRESAAAALPVHLASVHGKISTVGLTGPLDQRTRKIFLDLGVSRFCPAGKMQFPPLAWHHDGRAALAELVTWIDDETPMA